MNCVGIHAYGGSLSIALSELGFKPMIQLEAEQEHYRVASRFFGDRVVVIDENRKWSDAIKWLKGQSIDLIYGQPVWQGGRQINNDVSSIDEKKDVDNFISIVKALEPRFVVMAASKRAESQITKRIKKSFYRSDGETWYYNWSMIRTNAILHGVPQDRDILFVVGFKDFADKVRFHNVLLARVPKQLADVDEIASVWKAIEDLSEIEPTPNGTISFQANEKMQLVNNHILPGEKNSILSRLLYESIPLLKEGDSFDDIEERPAVVKEKGDNYFLKGQLPVRLHRNLPAPSIYSAERYIHPVLNRPMTLRELARLFGVPNNFDLGGYYGPGLTVLGRFVPIPVSKWLFEIIAETISNSGTYESRTDNSLGDYDLFAERSRDTISELKRRHGKWVDAYAQRALLQRNAG